MECRTKTGLFYMMIGYLIAFVSSIFIGLFFYIERTVETDGPSSFIALALIPGVVAIIGGIIGFVGFIFLLIGMNEFGEKHKRSVIWALILYITAIVVSSMASVVPMYASMSIMSDLPSEDVESAITNAMIAAAAVAIASGVIGAVASMLWTYQLQAERGRLVLWIGFVAAVGVLPLHFIPNVGGLTSFAGFPGSFLFFLALYLAYNRIKNGELRPLPPPLPYYPCLQCHWPLRWDQETGRWVCERCGIVH